MPLPTLGDRRLVARAGLALVLANVRYWTSVAPIVRRELRRWELRAQGIQDPDLRALALQKLHGEGFHAEAAAMLATLAPRSRRGDAVEAIVALELLFDYLDGLTERPSADPLADGELLFGALVNAVALVPTGTREPFEKPELNDNGYLEGLSRAVVVALARLPAAPAITEIAQRIAARSGQAQTRMHAAAQLGRKQVEQWARGEADGTGLQWRELLAGSASSVLALHALIVAAADSGTTPLQADEIASAYLSTCVLLTLLDGLVDYEQDQSHEGRDQPHYLSLYEDRQELAEVLSHGAQRAAMQARELPNGAHHAMTLAGVVAYYSSAPGAGGELAAPVVKRLDRQLAPLIYPTLALMRGWRLAKRIRNRRTPAVGGLASSMRESGRPGGCNEI
jgi:tetraprenyl-beta-curcumene synthase